MRTYTHASTLSQAALSLFMALVDMGYTTTEALAETSRLTAEPVRTVAGALAKAMRTQLQAATEELPTLLEARRSEVQAHITAVRAGDVALLGVSGESSALLAQIRTVRETIHALEAQLPRVIALT